MAVKLERLIIKNFRSIGSTPVEVELDDIVILVGGNNTGKSTILKAYHAAVNHESLTIDDFHNRKIDKDNLPTIEIHTLCSGEDKPSDKFYVKAKDETPETFYLIKEQFIWEAAGAKNKPVRSGFRPDLGDFAPANAKPRMPWSNDNGAKSKRPKAHLVDTFSDPDKQTQAIKNILVEIFLEDSIRCFTPKGETNNYNDLQEQLASLKKEFLEDSKTEFTKIAKTISEDVSNIVRNHEVKIEVNDSGIADSNLKLFDASDIDITFGRDDNFFPVHNHGSGARRTLLWSVLKKIAELGYESKEKGKFQKIEHYKSHLLLLDEPELSLHPSACRETRDMLYNLAERNDNWQIMVTTHSPSFIDLTRDHTKIIRVEDNVNEVKATTIFKPDQVSFTSDESESLKLFNLLNPDVMEFFFGGKVLLVEGDTEYSAFGKIIKDYKDKKDATFDDLFILRCGGKVQVSMFMKILNHFKKDYFVLHDIDSKQIIKLREMKVDGTDKKVKKPNIEKNPAWTNNSKILEQMTEYSSVYGSIINFETAYFNESIGSGKPDNAITKLKDKDIYSTVERLLISIIKKDDKLLPSGAIRWTELAQISDKFDTYALENPEVVPKLPE